MTKEIRGKKVKVLPIRLEKCKVPEYLKDKLFADFTDPNKYSDAFASLLHAMNIPRPTINYARAKPEKSRS